MDTRFRSPPRTGTMSRGGGGRAGDLETGRSSHYTSTLEDMADPLHSMSTYHDYPSTQPFINDPYRRPADKPTNTYPESNRQAVMSALKGLQDKIRKLELERSHAEDNLKMLATETSRYQDILQQGNDTGPAPPHTTVSQDTQELESHLQAAENRSNLLEKQLEYMRRMVHTAEADRSEAIRRSQLLEAQRSRDNQYDFTESNRKEKLNDLEREHVRLTASQQLAETKIRELEDKLREERHHRKLMQEKTAQAASAKETNRILMKTGNIENKTKKKKVVVQKANRKAPIGGKEEAHDHYRLNLADMPFVAGKSTTPSHSVPANVQKVLSMMKTHNSQLCPCSPRSARAAEQRTTDHYSTNNHRSTNDHHTAWAPPRTTTTTSTNGLMRGGQNLADLLLQLQDEFGHLSYEHQELSAQIHEVDDPRLRDDLERELDYIVAKMETKGNQISMLRKHQQSIHKKKKKAKAARTRPASASATIPSAPNGEVEVRTTIRTKGSKADSYARQTVSSASKASLKFLQDLKKIQSTLRKDDLSWDC